MRSIREMPRWYLPVMLTFVVPFIFFAAMIYSVGFLDVQRLSQYTHDEIAIAARNFTNALGVGTFLVIVLFDLLIREIQQESPPILPTE